MTRQTKELILAMLIFLITMVGIILVSNVVRINHDNLIRQQTLETCKEYK